MERRHALSVIGMLLAAALALGLARWEEGQLWGMAEDRLPKPAAEPVLDADEARQLLRTYFMDCYSEASCSAVYTAGPESPRRFTAVRWMPAVLLGPR